MIGESQGGSRAKKQRTYDRITPNEIGLMVTGVTLPRSQSCLGSVTVLVDASREVRDSRRFIKRRPAGGFAPIDISFAGVPAPNASLARPKTNAR